MLSLQHIQSEEHKQKSISQERPLDTSTSAAEEKVKTELRILTIHYWDGLNQKINKLIIVLKYLCCRLQFLRLDSNKVLGPMSQQFDGKSNQRTQQSINH